MLIHEELTYKIRGLCYEIQKQYGGYHKEVVYHRALNEKLIREGMTFTHEPKIPIRSVDTGARLGWYQPDFLIGDVILEVKAKPFIARAHKQQLYDYLKSSDYEVGLLVNFCSEGCQIVRQIYTNDWQQKSRV